MELITGKSWPFEAQIP